MVEAFHSAFEYAEAALIGSFFARFEEALEAEADAEERDACSDTADERVADIQFIERSQRVLSRKWPTPGEYDLRGTFESPSAYRAR